MATEVYSINIRGTVFGNVVENVLHMKAIDSNNALTPTDIAAKLAIALNDSTGWLQAFLNCVTDDYLAHSLVVKCVSAPGAATIVFQPQLELSEGTYPPGDAGTMPVNLAGALRLDLPVPKRSGRVYFPAVAEEAFTSGVAETTYLDALSDFGVEHVTESVSGTLTYSGVVYHKDGYNGGFSTPVPVALQYAYQQGGRRYPLGG